MLINASLPDPVYLEKCDAAQGQARFYALHLAPTLFGDWTLVREWGRIGSPGQIVVDWFESVEDACNALEQKQREKIRKGYRVRGGAGESEAAPVT